MTGLDGNFINKYKEFTKPESDGGKGLSENELVKLEKMVSSGQIDPTAAKALREEIIKGGISGTEKQLLLAIGHALGTDETKLNKFKEALDSDPVNGQVSNLIDRGFQERKNENKREANSSPVETFFREVSDASGLTTLSKAYSAYSGVDVSINTPSEEADQETRQLVSGNAPIFRNSVEDVDCIKDSLTAIADRNPGIFKLGEVPTKAVSQVYLQQVTGQVWDGINVKQSGDNLKDLLKDQAGKALIVVGAHTFVFEGFDKDNNLKVTDPSDGNKARTIDKNNPAASAFVLGYGDGGTTKALNKGTVTQNLKDMVQPYNKINASMNSADKNNDESLNIRKVLSLMGDPGQKESFAAVKNFIHKGDVNGLKDFLSKKGIKLDTDEVENMITKMREPFIVNGKKTSMIDQLENLQKASENDKTHYQFGIQYSDVNLKDFFTRTSCLSMYEVFQDMIAGRDGC
jgi:hypothetical protein